MNKWYVYENDEVVGPFAREELADRIDPETLVCPAGEEDWIKAEGIEELSTLLNTTEKESPAAEVKEPAENKSEPPVPTLEKLRTICKQASNEELAREFQEFWDEYDSQERRLLRNEMVNRNIWSELTEADAEDEQDLPV